MLYSLNQEQLARTVFPLGGMTKAEVRAIAEENNIVTAHKSESQDICFVRDGDYAGLIEGMTGRTFEEGDFVDESGNVIGRHKGIVRYTIGQRKGLGIAAGKPVFVYEKDAENNIVRVGEESLLFGKVLEAHNINLIACDHLDRPIRGEVKIRYSHRVSPAAIEQTGEDTLRVEFDEPQRAITKGQSVVIYDGDTVIGGGIIA